MSAAAAAKQRLDELHQQLEAYKERMKQQEQDLNRLKSEMAQTRTVVQVTIPSEIRRANKEYACTMYVASCCHCCTFASMLTLYLITQVIL